MIWHQADRTVIGREELDKQLDKLVKEDEWIIDGNYARTLPKRLAHCDTVFFFDIPLEVCIEGARSRLGKERVDMPWVDDELDPEFLQWIIDFPRDVVPEIEHHLKNFDKTVVRFHSREEANEFIESSNEKADNSDMGVSVILLMLSIWDKYSPCHSNHAII